MAKKITAWKTRGMNRDLSVSAFNPEFAFENKNLRLITNEGNTMMSWVNERGTLKIGLVRKNTKWNDEPDDQRVTNVTEIKGVVIGTAVLNHQLVLFTHDKNDPEYPDSIYLFKYSNPEKTMMKGLRLYAGILNFSTEHPLETAVNYEAETVQKVYWTDGINQPRVINIATKDFTGKPDTYFDFVPTLQLHEEVTVQKMLGANGMFAPGVIQYAFTYYNKYGQESNIFYTTPLLYTSHRDRGASPEDKVDNAFKITVENIDTNFDYLRIYSIQRTSINGTPICKRVQDIEINGDVKTDKKASYTDTGMSGDSIDPTELFYKGGENISAETLEQKDGNLFLGNIKIKRYSVEDKIDNNLKQDIQSSIHPNTGFRVFNPQSVSNSNYVYENQLTSVNNNNTVPCSGFKNGDYYRLGVQFQYKSGKWSEPIVLWKDGIDWIQDQKPFRDNNGSINIPIFKADIDSSIIQKLINKNYKKVRAVAVFPSMQDRVVLCQGVVNPTLYTENMRYGENSSTNPEKGSVYAQSSWFFRPYTGNNFDGDGGTETPINVDTLEYAKKGMSHNFPNSGDETYNPTNIRRVEIQGDYNPRNRFKIDKNCLTFNSPDIEFDNSLMLTDFLYTTSRQIGYAEFEKTLSDIDIQTETPTISSSGNGFIHKSFVTEKSYGIISGLFYDDFMPDDWTDYIGPSQKWKSSVKWLVYTWNKTGSLNADINRPTNLGAPTAKLKKKIISNLRFSTTKPIDNIINRDFSESPQLFSSDEASIVKLGNYLYKGNVDTMLSPDNADGMYFAFDNEIYTADHQETDFQSNLWWKTFALTGDSDDNFATTYKFRSNSWIREGEATGDHFQDLALKKENVRMKYKSAAHLVFRTANQYDFNNVDKKFTLPIVEIVRNNVNTATLFGGNSSDALRENTWVPCGNPVDLEEWNESSEMYVPKSTVEFEYSYGDTYYQRWDCLKTYAFTREDENQVVEIGSFMLESRINCDGRYDRNRGQINNLNMSPQNFNLLNPVYSQIDNFFSYKIMPDDYYKNDRFPNQITWSKTKENGADVDLWTNITLASILELDGDKGSLNKLTRLNDQLIAFQDSGISQILYNENVQIQSTQGVPIEIANSGKVQGKRYLSNTIGCSNKWSITQTPNGIYFMDSNDRSIYLFNGQLQNISQIGGFNAWCKLKIPPAENRWLPEYPEDNHSFISFYDRRNQDVLFVNDETALAWSEKLQVFTSFYSYEKVPFLCNLDDTSIWVGKTKNHEADDPVYYLWKHQSGDYCDFFDDNRDYSMTLIGNPEPQTDKTFTNLEFRASVSGDGTDGSRYSPDTFDHTFDITFHSQNIDPTGNFTPYLPFDSLEVWNEYQHGMHSLKNKEGHDAFNHFKDGTASLRRKFRIWRCDIPRDNIEVPVVHPLPENPTPEQEAEHAAEEARRDIFIKNEADMGIFRYSNHSTDRMRNPWIYLKLHKDPDDGGTMHKTEIHDLIMTYFN